MTLEKRLSDVESSIKVIAQYVKEQTAKLENDLAAAKGTEALYDAKPEIEEIKQKLAEIHSSCGMDIEELKQKAADIDFLKEKMDSFKVKAPEYDDSALKKSLQMIRAELNDFRNDISPKVQFLDKKTDKLKEAAESMSEIEDLKRHVEKVDKRVHETLAIKEELDDIEETLGKMKSLANRLKDFDAANYKEQFEKQMRSVFGEMKHLEESDMKKISEFAENMKHIEADDMKKVTQLAEQLKGMEEKDFNNLGAKLRHLEKMNAEDTEKVAEFAKHLQDFEEKDLKNFASKLKHLEKISSNDAHKLAELAGSLSEFEEKDFKSLAEKLKHLEKLETNDAKKLIETAESLREVEAHDIRNMAKHWKEAKESMEEEAVSRMAFEKRILDLEQLVSKFKQIEHSDVKRLNEFVQQLKSGEIEDIKKLKESIEGESRKMKEAFEGDARRMKESFETETKRLNTAFEYVQGMELEELKQIAGNITEAKAALEDESISRISTEKRLGGLEAKLARMDNVVNHIDKLEGMDVEKISNRINDLESSMKMNTVKLLTQQLNEFAKSMDRRIPNVVSREEYMRQVADLNQRMRTIEAPDLSPLGARVERLEQKIEEVAAMMRQMYNRVPIVVE